jgi:hypothetical protein
MFENKVVRNIFGTKREKTEGEWKSLHNEELHKVQKYYLGGQIKEASAEWDIQHGY